MKSTFLYVVLTIIAVALIAVTISLQVMLLSERNGAADQVPAGSAGNQEAIQGQTNGSNPGMVQVLQPTAAVATNTPMIIFVRPTPDLPTVVVPTVEVIQPIPTPTAAQVAQVPAAALPPVVESEPKFDPRDFVLDAKNVLISEDNNLLASVLINQPNAIGVIPYAYYQPLNASLRAVKLQVGGVLVEPTQESVANGFYPLERNLYLYTSIDTLTTKPAVAAFISCYLHSTPTESPLVGYFAPLEQDLQNSINRLQISTGNSAASSLPGCSSAGVDATTIATIGSTTVAPLTERMAALFKAQGFRGAISVEKQGTSKGFQEYCANGSGDIISAGRQINKSESDQCRAAGREMIEFVVAEDAMVIAISKENGYVDNLTFGMLWKAFSAAQTWAEVNPAWPAEPVVRAIPGTESSTLEEFVEMVYQPGSIQLAQSTNSTVLPATVSVPQNPPVPAATASIEPVAPPVKDVDYIIGYHEGRKECTEVANMIATVLEVRYDRKIELQPFINTDSMYDDVARNNSNVVQQIDFTPCYTDRDDRVYLRANGSKIALMNNAYAETGENKLFLAAHSSLPPTLKFDDSCVYEFLRNINLGTLPEEGFNAASWIDSNGALLNEWTRCEEGN